MPDTEPVEQQGLPSGTEQNQTLPQQPSQLPLPARFDGANGYKPGRVLDSVEPPLRTL